MLLGGGQGVTLAMILYITSMMSGDYVYLIYFNDTEKI